MSAAVCASPSPGHGGMVQSGAIEEEVHLEALFCPSDLLPHYYCTHSYPTTLHYYSSTMCE